MRTFEKFKERPNFLETEIRIYNTESLPNEVTEEFGLNNDNALDTSTIDKFLEKLNNPIAIKYILANMSKDGRKLLFDKVMGTTTFSTLNDNFGADFKKIAKFIRNVILENAEIDNG